MRRLITAILAGSFLGIFCVIGVSIRQDIPFGDPRIWYIFYNRIIIGLVAGLAGSIKIKPVLRGALAGLIVSFSTYIVSGFTDFITFFMGILYGIIIDITATKYE